MRAFIKNQNYVFMMERTLDELNRVQNRSLEADVMDENNVPTRKRAILQYERSRELDFSETTDSVKVTIGHQIIIGIINHGFYQKNYHEKHFVCITDGISPSRFI